MKNQPKNNNYLVNELAKAVRFCGGEAYLVGGCVRDEILGQTPKDVDCEVFGIDEIKLFAVLTSFAARTGLTLSEVGKSFKVFKLRASDGEEIDVSLPRRDEKIGQGHKGFKVVADPFMSTFEAASRRDFTINSMMKNLLTGEIIDHFNGRADLSRRVIKMTSPDIFADDPLRALRAIQFASRFQFRIDEKTLSAMQFIDLRELPAERIFTELEKILMKSEKPSWGLQLAQAFYPDFFRELADLREVKQDEEWHPEGVVLVHTMMVVDEMAILIRKLSALSYPEKLTLMLAALCHDFGKASTTEFLEGRWRAHGHSEAGIAPTTDFLNRLNVFTIDNFPVRKTVLNLVMYHLSPPQFASAKDRDRKFNVKTALRRLSLKVHLGLLAWVSLADQLGRAVSKEKKDNSINEISWFLAEAAQVGVMPPKPILMGRHLLEMGYKPGEEIGRICAAVFELQLSGQIANLEQAKEFVKSGGIGVALNS